MVQTLKSFMLLLLLASCSSVPSGPGVLVLPGADKGFTEFHNDDVNCRQYARSQINTSKDKPNTDEEGQQLYDIGFIQCMYGKGHRVPIPENVMYDAVQDWDEPLATEMEPPQ